MRYIRRSLAILLAAAVVSAGPVWADIDDGVAALVRGDYATALKEFRPLAEQGDAIAQTGLGAMYLAGYGVPQDYAEAVQWFRLAAEQGDGDAQNNLGGLYRYGKGVAQDYVLAHMWLNLAAAEGGENAAKHRDIVAKMMTAADVSKAQQMAREWLTARGKVN